MSLGRFRFWRCCLSEPVCDGYWHSGNRIETAKMASDPEPQPGFSFRSAANAISLPEPKPRALG
jgi:hypothetical protein